MPRTEPSPLHTCPILTSLPWGLVTAPVLQSRVGSRDLSNHLLSWRWLNQIWNQWCLNVKPLYISRVFPWLLLLLLFDLSLGSSSYLEEDLISGTMVPFIRTVSHGSWGWNLHVRLTHDLDPVGTSFVTLCQLLHLVVLHAVSSSKSEPSCWPCSIV